MFDLNVVFTYISPIIVIACLVIGYVIKHAIPGKTVNAFIPLILAALGIIANVWYLGSFNLETVTAGAVSGLAATGLYEAFSNLLNLPKLNAEEDTTELHGDHFAK